MFSSVTLSGKGWPSWNTPWKPTLGSIAISAAGAGSERTPENRSAERKPRATRGQTMGSHAEQPMRSRVKTAASAFPIDKAMEDVGRVPGDPPRQQPHAISAAGVGRCFPHSDEAVVAEAGVGFVLQRLVDQIRIVQHARVEMPRLHGAVGKAHALVLVYAAVNRG